MTEKQKIFADQYLIDRNGTQAALRAGYAVSSSRLIAHQLLNNEEVKAYIKERLDALSNSAYVDLEFIVNRFKDISDRCMQAEPVMIFDGEQWVESGEYKFDATGASKATEMLGKIIGVFEKDNDQKKNEIAINITQDDSKLGE